jgi:hypothetical protein
MFLIGPWLALRARHPCFFTAANPGIFSGGFGLESKWDSLREIPEPWRPKSILARRDDNFDDIEAALAANGIGFPLIAKPAVGFRGLLVRKIDEAGALQRYLREHPVDFLVQEFIDYPTELGVLYLRLPGEETGRITSLTIKEFLAVRGDGRSSVRQLIAQSPRAILQLERLEKSHPALLDRIPAPDEHVPLDVVGNHSKGTRFINGNRFIDDRLVAVFDDIARQMEGFHYGRFDLKCDSLEDLRQGGRRKIIEVNGVCAEPTHIYDSTSTSYFGALRDIVRHWCYIGRISAHNHAHGAPCLPPGEMIKALLDLRRYLRRVAAFSSSR